MRKKNTEKTIKLLSDGLLISKIKKKTEILMGIPAFIGEVNSNISKTLMYKFNYE